MKKLTLSVTTLLLAGLFLSGCAPYSFNMRSLLGTNISDLEKARSKGVSQTFDIPYSSAFDRVETILKSNGQIIFESSKRKDLIVAMNFPKQTTTTRVGIFFEPVSDNKTKITLSSLSSTALEKAESTIFSQLSPGVEIIK